VFHVSVEFYRRDSARRRSLRRSRSFKVTLIPTKSPLCDFKFVNNTNLHHISYHFPVIAQYLSNYWFWRAVPLLNTYVFGNLCEYRHKSHMYIVKKLDSSYGATGNAGLENVGPKMQGWEMRDQVHIVIWIEKNAKCAVHSCVTFILSFAGVYWSFCHCCSYFRIQLTHQRPTWHCITGITCYARVHVELIICISSPAFSRSCIFQSYIFRSRIFSARPPSNYILLV